MTRIALVCHDRVKLYWIIDLGRIYAAEEFYDVPKVDKNAIPDPKVGFEYPDDEEFEDIGLWSNQ